MPELPEVETVRLSLSRDLIGKKVKSALVTNGRVVRRHKTARDFRVMVEGHSIRSIDRLGKNLIIGLDNSTHLIVHLGMSGQLLRAKSAKDLKPKHTHAVFTFAQGGELRYVDPRTFGELYVSTPPGEATPRTRSRSSRVSRSAARDWPCARRFPSWRTSGSIRSRTRSAGTASPPCCAVARRR